MIDLQKPRRSTASATRSTERTAASVAKINLPRDIGRHVPRSLHQTRRELRRIHTHTFAAPRLAPDAVPLFQQLAPISLEPPRHQAQQTGIRLPMTRQRADLFEQPLELAIRRKMHAKAVLRQRLELSLNRRHHDLRPHRGWVDGDRTLCVVSRACVGGNRTLVVVSRGRVSGNNRTLGRRAGDGRCRIPHGGTSGGTGRRQPSNRIGYIWLGKACRQQLLDLLATLATTDLEQSRCIVRGQVPRQRRKHRSPQLTPPPRARTLPDIAGTPAPPQCADTQTTYTARARPCNTRTST